MKTYQVEFIDLRIGSNPMEMLMRTVNAKNNADARATFKKEMKFEFDSIEGKDYKIEHIFVFGLSNVKESMDTETQVWNALRVASKRIGENNYRIDKAKWLKTHKNMKNFKPTISKAQEDVINAIKDMDRGRITPQQAMAVLHEYDVSKERLM